MPRAAAFAFEPMALRLTRLDTDHLARMPRLRGRRQGGTYLSASRDARGLRCVAANTHNPQSRRHGRRRPNHLPTLRPTRRHRLRPQGSRRLRPHRPPRSVSRPNETTAHRSAIPIGRTSRNPQPYATCPRSPSTTDLARSTGRAAMNANMQEGEKHLSRCLRGLASKIFAGRRRASVYSSAGCAWSLVRPVAMSRAGERADGSHTSDRRKHGEAHFCGLFVGTARRPIATPRIAGIAASRWRRVRPLRSDRRGFMRGVTATSLEVVAREASACSRGPAIGLTTFPKRGGVGGKSALALAIYITSRFRAASLETWSGRPQKFWPRLVLKISGADDLA